MAITTQNTGAALTGPLRDREASSMGRMKITNATIVNGRHAAVGEIVEVDTKTARSLIANGKAVPWADAPEAPTVRTAAPDPGTHGGEPDPGKSTDDAGPSCRVCGQDLSDRRRKRVEDSEGLLLCGKCAKE